MMKEIWVGVKFSSLAQRKAQRYRSRRMSSFIQVPWFVKSRIFISSL